MRPGRKREALARRHHRVRKKVAGTAERPRLAVFRSNRHIYAQLIDDRSARTLASASDLSVAPAADGGSGGDGNGSGAAAETEGGKTAVAREVGKALAATAKAAGIERAVFDRGGRLYHGRVKALAEGAREGGLEI
jgi:large subunit ribosomal protein L18